MLQNAKAAVLSHMAKVIRETEDLDELMLHMVENDLFFIAFDSRFQVTSARVIQDLVSYFLSSGVGNDLTIVNVLQVWRPNARELTEQQLINEKALREALAQWYDREAHIEQWKELDV